MDTKRKKREPLNLNMRILRRSRRPVSPGDIFVLQVLRDQYHFGRVIRSDIQMMGDDDILAYVYRVTSGAKHPTPVLDKSNLLIPPIVINRQMWTLGYWETVENRTLSREDVLPVHCFYTYSLLDPAKIKYFDENKRELKEPVEPCGVQGMHPPGAVDNEISDALSIPRCAASLERDRERPEVVKKAQASRKRGLQHLAKNAKGRETLRKLGIREDEYM